MKFLVLNLLCSCLLIQLSIGQVVEDYDYGSNDYQQQVFPDSTAFPSSNRNVKSNSEKFATDLYKQIVKDETKSVIFSPLSIQTALSMAMFGANGDTKQEMKIAMHFENSTDEYIQENFKSLSAFINATEGLKVANKIYVANGYSIKPNFCDIARESFNSEAQNINFNSKVAAARTINKWVEDHTSNKIIDLISPNSLNANTKMILVNAIYFKGEWETKFVPQRTGKKEFYLDADNTVIVDMMEIEANYKYGKDHELNVDILELPYKQSDISMMFFLPTNSNQLSELEDRISELNIQGASSRLYYEDVIVEIPKFKIEFDISLKQPLVDVGMKRMFSHTEFSELLQPSERLSVSDVVHKAFIEINEEGAEAAAASGITFQRRTGFIEEKVPIFFKADHPFLFVLKSSTETLFIGRYNGV